MSTRATFTRYLSAIVAGGVFIGLTACGGGGGGGSGDSTSSATTSGQTQTTTTPATTPQPATLASPSPGTTAGYEAAYVQFNYAPAPAGQTPLSAVSVGAPQPGSNSSQAHLTANGAGSYQTVRLVFPGFDRVWTASQLLVYPVDPKTGKPGSFLEDAGNTPGAEFSAWGPEAGLAYAATGTWLKDSPTPNTAGTGGLFAIGEEPSLSALRTSGTGTYTGKVRGLSLENLASGIVAGFEADAVITVNFATKQATVTTSGTVVTLTNGTTVARADLNVSGSGIWTTTTRFAGSIANGAGANALTGSLLGHFRGPTGQEATVLFSIARPASAPGGAAFLVGAFAAKGG